METTAVEKDCLRVIISKLIENDQDWFKQNYIIATAKGSFWILNYSPEAKKNYNDYNRLVRGLVVARPEGFVGDLLELIRSFPYDRFFNQGEPYAADVDMSNADMLEKMDGTMVATFFPTKNLQDLHFQTRKMLSSHEEDWNRKIRSFYGVAYPFLPLIGSYVKKLNFNESDLDYTYIFEFIHEASKVLTEYSEDEWGLVLTGGRNVRTHRELSEAELDIIAVRLGVRRPRKWESVADHDEILKMMDLAVQERKDFEGYIFRDRKSGKRIKIKDRRYVEKHYIIGNASFKRLVPVFFSGEVDEVSAYLPIAKERLATIGTAYENYLDHVVAKVAEWRAKGLQGKDLAFALFGRHELPTWQRRLSESRGEPIENPKAAESKFICNMVLKFSKFEDDVVREKVAAELKRIGAGCGTNAGSPRDFLDLIGLKRELEFDDLNEAEAVGEL